MFSGYPFGEKAYKLLNLETHQVFTSRDVIFHETILPYHHLSVTNGPPMFPASSSYGYHDPEGFSNSFPNTNAEHRQNTLSSSPLSTPGSNSSPHLPSPQPTRRSNRPHKTPSYLSEYVCSNVMTDSSQQFCYPNTVTSICCNVTSVGSDSLPS